MSFTVWSPVQACVWIARRDDIAVAAIPDGCTFEVLAFIAEQEVNESDPNAFIIGVDDMTTLQLSRALDKRQRGMEPDTGWIERAKAELLGACRAGRIEMAGRSLCSDGGSQKIPAGIFSDVGFAQRGNVVSLEEADMRDGACWIALSLVAAEVRNEWPKDAMEAEPHAIGTAGVGAMSDAPIAESAARVATNGESPAPAPTPAPDHPVSDTIIMASMESEILKRRDAGGRTTRPAIVLAMTDEFRGRLTERRVRELYKKLPKELKGKRGPQGPRISRQNS